MQPIQTREIPGFEGDRGGSGLLHFLESTPQLLFFGGKGGVGKTTAAAAVAIRLARTQPRSLFLLVSTDPAHSLTDSLAGTQPPKNLEILELDSKACLEEFKSRHDEKLREIARRGTCLDDEDITRFLQGSLPGMDELVAVLEISRLVRSGKFGCVVVDTAPAGHTLRLLEMPKLVKRWLSALDALLAKHRFMKKLFTGAYTQDELDKFLLGLLEDVKLMEKLLRDSARCLFVPVMIAEEMSINETLMLLSDLKRANINVREVIVNRIYPDTDCAACRDVRSRQLKRIAGFSDGLSKCLTVGAPMCADEIKGVSLLEHYLTRMRPVGADFPAAAGVRANVRESAPAPSLLASNPAPLINESLKLLVFAGKGGVGKTTISCSTAVRLSREARYRNILIFSTDPAHSLGDCFGTEIGPEIKKISDGLWALEIDASAEFESLKRLYAREVKRFFGAISDNFDLTFDREVIERMMDLSPPGVDEIMGLAKVMEYLAADEYFLILDTAPTGHLIRLLEMPELIDQWLKQFFNLFLKYKNIFNFPRVRDRLIGMSKNLKALRKTLSDPGRSALFPVAIPTEMAFEETKDLVEACRRMGVNVQGMFVNLTTPPCTCPFCSALVRREARIGDKFAASFPGWPITTIYRNGEPKGLDDLGRLGERIYL